MIRWGSSKQTDESLEKNAGSVLRNCQKRRDDALNCATRDALTTRDVFFDDTHRPTFAAYRVKTLMDALLEAGCPLPPQRIYCAVCKELAMGGYFPREHKVGRVDGCGGGA